MISLICLNCKIKFATRNKLAKYCSKPCSNSGRAHLKQHKFENLPKTLHLQNNSSQTTHSVGTLHVIPAINDHRSFDVIPTDNRPAFIQFNLDGKSYAASGERWAAEAKEKDVLTLAGNGCSLQVDKGQLVLRSGYSCSTVTEREKRITRGVHAVRAIIVINTTGNLSTAAIQWCSDQRIALYVLDRDANLTALTHPPTPHVVSLRRLQYSVEPLTLAKEILYCKFDACIKSKPILTISFTQSADSILYANTLEEIRLIEARAAIIYWSTWNNCVIKWKEKDVPIEWKGFTQRASGISGKGYKATHPVNAILNYAYAILAGQVERTLQIAGLDVAVGSLHADQDGRASLVYDLMEPLRPVIDKIIFAWVTMQRWRRADFVIDRHGVIRVHPQLARIVVTKTLLPDKMIREEINAYVSLLKQLSNSKSAVTR
ncbi:CRISPR-associated endonuclease Cas1 [Nitrosomonas sp.]|uniref:CRISPR-associated endonuclease Cas1 n=1 Tax=Nitrosomonas sp. TaxID=42353 RepID=UPI00374D62AF